MNKNKLTPIVKNGGKWTMKYKKSINCKNPKGFSQKQYCMYGKKNKKNKKNNITICF